LWRLRSAQVSGKSLQVRVAQGLPAHADVTVTDEAWLVDGQPSSRLDLSPAASILLHNTTGYEVVVSVDDPAPQLEIVTGAQVAALQAFRARFTQEVVPGVGTTADSQRCVFVYRSACVDVDV
jgi:hypothetical protein